MILSASSLRKQGPQRERARVHRYAVKAAIEAGVVSLFIQAMRAGGYGSPEFTNEVQHFRLEVLPWGGVTNSFHWKINARLPAFGSMALDPANRGGNAGVRVTVWLFENLELSAAAHSYPSHSCEVETSEARSGVARSAGWG
jgi:hypothetical protein